MKKIIITGPESSGKTTLYNNLIKYYETVGVSEFSREYIENLKREYNYQDILEIAKIQLKSEKEFFNNNQKFLIADTDLLTLEIWCEFKYGKCHSFILENLRANTPHVYLLCYPDIPWEYDPLRESPNDRYELFKIYKSKIKSLGVKFSILKGSRENRFDAAKKIINKILY